MDQAGENPPITSSEALNDAEEESRKGIGWPVAIVVGAVCLSPVILLWPMQIPNTPEAGRLSPPSSASSLALKTDAPRQSLTYYHQVIAGGLFHAPQPPLPRRQPPDPPARKKTPPLPPTPATPNNPYADWVYAGAVKRGSRILALLENTRSKEGQYVVAGDPFQDAQVESVTEQRVTLKAAGKRYTIPKSEAVSAISLDKNAPYLANNAGGQPGAPPPPPAPGAPPTPPAQAQPSTTTATEGDSNNAEQTSDSPDQ